MFICVELRHCMSRRMEVEVGSDWMGYGCGERKRKWEWE
jgi:hypothetical protein